MDLSPRKISLARKRISKIKCLKRNSLRLSKKRMGYLIIESLYNLIILLSVWLRLF